MRAVGAPNLTDAIWLFGGDRDSLTQTVTNAHYGVMPAWGTRLDPVTVKMLAAYVHSLGGGEDYIPDTPTAGGATPALAVSSSAATPTATTHVKP